MNIRSCMYFQLKVWLWVLLCFFNMTLCVCVCMLVFIMGQNKGSLSQTHTHHAQSTQLCTRHTHWWCILKLGKYMIYTINFRVYVCVCVFYSQSELLLLFFWWMWACMHLLFGCKSSIKIFINGAMLKPVIVDVSIHVILRYSHTMLSFFMHVNIHLY